MDARLSRIRAWTLFLIVGLVLSGLTAIPLRLEVDAGAALLGEDFHRSTGEIERELGSPR